MTGPTLPTVAIEFMNVEEPDGDALRSLDGLSGGVLEALVAALEHRDQLDHLELVAGLTSATRELRKAAGAAAHRLRARGVKPRRKPVQAKLEAQAEPTDLSFVALASPPGLVGRFWMLLGSLPGTEAIEVKGDADGGIEGIEIVRPVSGSKLEKLAREFERKTVRGLPVRASADLAVRLVRAWNQVLPQDRIPPMWREVETWRQAAVALGADPNRASARIHLSKAQAPLPFPDLYRLDAGGIHLPTPAVIQRVLAGMRDMLDQPAVEVARVEAHAAGLTREAMGAWLSVAETRARLARWLEATADILYAHKQLAGAAGFVALADALGPAEDGYKLVEHPFFHEVEVALLGSSTRPR
ncbi:MAG: hypothetical protein IT385_20565 [Deltaproteobacteria bacterium]|nr:hypothetical protein [Deltaproteobacteria bacterium]